MERESGLKYYEASATKSSAVVRLRLCTISFRRSSTRSSAFLPVDLLSEHPIARRCRRPHSGRLLASSPAQWPSSPLVFLAVYVRFIYDSFERAVLDV